MIKRLEQLAEDPYSAGLSARLKNKGELRKSRVGGWRIIFHLNDPNRALSVVTIERRSQVYQRL
jgi:mRNA interferase RelE/StbE